MSRRWSLLTCAITFIFIGLSKICLMNNGHEGLATYVEAMHKLELSANDVNKITIPEEVLNQPSATTEEIETLMIPPSTKKQNLKLRTATDFSQAGQSKYVDEILHGMRNGFFVECRAANGVDLSNTLFAELERNWTGLLIEPNPYLFKKLNTSRIHAYAINACLSLTKYPSIASFSFDGVHGGIIDGKLGKPRNTADAKCFPLYDILRTIGQLHINYLSLDVEGFELEILKTIPFDRVIIDVMTVEYSRKTPSARLAALYRLRDFVLGTGLYTEVAILNIKKGAIEGEKMKAAEPFGLDVVFKRRSLL